MEAAVIEYTWLILFVTVGIEGHAPSLFISEVTYPAQMHRCVPAALKVLFESFIYGQEQRSRRFLRLNVRIDITEHSVKADP